MSARILPLLVLSFVYGSIALRAQQTLSCGFDAAHQQQMKVNSVYRNAVQQHEAFVQQYLKNKKAGVNRVDQSVIIPVVVHVVHTGGVMGSIYNPTDVQIQNYMNYLNQVYAGTYYNEGVGDLGVQFALAQRDPNCNPTNGINHINGSGLSGYTANGVNSPGTTGAGPDEVTLKNLIRWDPTRYCNVWVVNMINGIDGSQGGGIAGFAYFPFDPTIDGVVIRAHEIAIGNSTLPHEMGHTLTLYHPFEGSNGNTCPPGDPTLGDKVADTDPVTNPNFFNPERTGPNPCTVPANQPYTSATERNIMSYVYTPTLFTAGQKTRMLAGAADPNRLSQQNSLGNIPTYQGGTTCPPKIDFESDGFQLTEATTGTTSISGCPRNYADYSFNLLIGNNPSVAPDVTLTVGGTAQEGVDFDITSNGDFSAPSKVIHFPAGAHNAKAFTVRVYDDADVEATETIVLGFTVNSNGGNAVAGDGRTTLTISVFDNDTAPYAAIDNAYTLNGSFNFGASVPFSGSAPQLKSQQLYKAAELTAAGVKAGNLVGLSMDIITKSTAAAFKYKGFTIRLAQMNNTTLADYVNNAVSPVPDVAFTTVYSQDYSTVPGTNTFNFSAPFAWDGHSNIAVAICYDNAGVTDANNDVVNFYSDDYVNHAAFIYQLTNCGTAFSSTPGYYNTDYRPVITFIRRDPGTTVQSTLNSSKQEYLGPNADIYFYDQTNGNLLARVKNLTAFNYGCTTVTIDRAGTSSAQFWNNNSANYLMNKTFHIVPTVNNPTGNYELTLYYTSNEVTGWQNTTGQSFNNIQLIKVPGQILSVTPANPNAAGTPLMVVPTRGTLGTNYFLDYTFSTGFSGFGAGMAGTALPVQLLDFTGSLHDKNILLNWKTSEEINSSLFGIERSYDGIAFTGIGTVAAKGNSNGASYQYTDSDIPHTVNYYRLRIVDKDGRFAYSKTILLKASDANAIVTLIANPVHNSLDLQFGAAYTGAPAVICLLDMTGRLVMQQVVNTGRGQVVRIALPVAVSNGVYMLQVQQGSKQYVMKLRKE